MKHLVFIGLLVAIGKVAATAEVKPWGSDELRSMCSEFSSKPLSDESQKCSKYVKGVIEVLAITQTTAHKGRPRRNMSDFKKRALQNRVGSRLELSDNSNVDAAICLDENVSTSELVQEVIGVMNQQAGESKTAANEVLDTLKQVAPCR